jgi:hypothetical protein
MPSISGSGRIRLSFPAGMGCSIDLSAPRDPANRKGVEMPTKPPGLAPG